VELSWVPPSTLITNPYPPQFLEDTIETSFKTLDDKGGVEVRQRRGEGLVRL
jgi:hypothetical protein